MNDRSRGRRAGAARLGDGSRAAGGRRALEAISCPDASIGGDQRPTLKQLEAFARATHVPFGYLLLSEPPNEPLPVPDFRTIAGTELRRPSADLLDTIFLCEQRQDWYREFAQRAEQDAVPFVNTLRVTGDPVDAATQIRSTLGFDPAARRQYGVGPRRSAAWSNRQRRPACS